MKKKVRWDLVCNALCRIAHPSERTQNIHRGALKKEEGVNEGGGGLDQRNYPWREMQHLLDLGGLTHQKPIQKRKKRRG